MNKFLGRDRDNAFDVDENPTKKHRSATSEFVEVPQSCATQSSTAKILEDSNASILTTAEINQARNTAATSNWTTYNDIMYKYNPNINRSNEMIAFDMDGTLITTKSGKTFAVNENDWKLLDSSIPGVLQRLHNEGKYLAIISNQNGIKAKKTTAKQVQDKVDAIMNLLNVPMDFICSTEDDKFRKPRTGMLEFLVIARCPDASQSSSIYVGDAAGREKEGARGKDFSDTDLKLALNLGIQVWIIFDCCFILHRECYFFFSIFQFQTPERFFMGSTSRLHNELKITSGIKLSDVVSCL